MPSFSTLAVLSSLALASVSVARPIPHTVTLFRRAILDANDGILIVQNQDAPKTYAAGLEPYDRYHFRYMAVGCSDADHNQVFFETCCHPRSAKKQSDADYPAACRLDSYLVFNPVYGKDSVTAKLGSVADYQQKMDYDNAEASSSTVEASSSSSASSSASPSSTWSSSTPAYTPSSSSSSSTWSSSTPTYTPSTSSETWSPPSSSWSSSSSWTPSSSSSEPPAPTWSSSSSPEWHAPAFKAAAVSTSSTSSWTPPATSAAPAPAPASNNNNGQTFTGTGSWYTQNGNAGACGVYHSDSDYIVALAAANYGNMGQKSPHCGQSITITNTNTGATANAIVADACPGCSSTYSLDLSTGLFQALANLDQGLIPISWHFN